MTKERETQKMESPAVGGTSTAGEVGIQPSETATGEERQKSFISATGVLRGGDIQLRNAAVGAVIGDEVEIERGFVRAAIATGELEIEQGGAGVVFSAGPTSIRQGGAQAIISAGSVTMEQAGGGVLLARQIELRGGTVVFGLTPRLNVADGGRVVFGPLPSLIAAGGLVALIATLVSVIRGARRGRRR